MIFQSRFGDPLFLHGKLVGTLIFKSQEADIYYYCIYKMKNNLFTAE